MALELKRLEDFDAYKVNFKGFGQYGTAIAGQTTNIDLQLSEERLVYGGNAVLKNHVFGDKITLQVVYKAGGVDTVLGEYVTNWGVADDKQQQDTIMVTYPTKVSAGLYLRIKYTSVGSTDVSVCINYYAVKNITE
jgi:hypothetical protein